MSVAIKAIEGSSVHRIQSGQVIVDLCSVAKELVENALDAGATSIDVRFRNHGLDSIEVQDNGSGISKENYESVALKHYTSKLRTYEDLVSLNTFGFRGEALSSLCALSKVHILTATPEEAPRGCRLDFAASGSLKSKQVVAAQRGTVVVIETLFENLPVRRQELTKNLKREYGKVLNLLQAYACVSVGVRFNVSNVVGKKKTAVFATQANKTVRENITNIFGQKTVTALTSLELEFEMESSRATKADEDKLVKIHGQISKPIVGEGRQTPDRQMFFVNSRPCSLPQISKAMNDVYKNYNSNQSPFIFANLILDTSAYDVNVSPDKRQILLHEQNALLESLKASLIARFDGHQQTVPQIQKRTTARLSLTQEPLHHLGSSTKNDVVDEPESRRLNPHSESQRQAFASPIPHRQSPEKPKSSQESPSTVKGLIYEFMGHNTGKLSATSSSSSLFLVDDETTGTDTSLKVMQNIRRSRSSDHAISSEDFDLAEQAAEDTDHSPSKQMQGFNRRLVQLHEQHDDDRATSTVSSSSLRREPPEVPPSTEFPIPSVSSSPAKPHLGVVPNAFERMRPMRIPKDTATITIGDRTTVQQIGGTWKTNRPRSRLLRQNKPKPVSQQFQSSLRAFAAPGSQAQVPSSDETGSSAESENDDNFQPEWPRRGPNKPPQDQQRASISESTDTSDEELVEVSEGVMTHRKSIASTSSVNDTADHDLEEDSEEEDASDEEWLDEDARRAKEDARVAKMIQAVESQAARPSHDHVRRAHSLLRGGHRDATTRFQLEVETDSSIVEQEARQLERSLLELSARQYQESANTEFDGASAEERLTLAVSKVDFGRMRVVGQFNLGFILAVRPGQIDRETSQITSRTSRLSDELFIIDQHASDEKSTFERLSATTVLQSQRLVRPHALELTAVEREVVARHQPNLVKNGFIVQLHGTRDTYSERNEQLDNENNDADPSIVNTNSANVSDDDDGDDTHTGPSPRATLLALPLSRETTFSPADLDELLALLPDDADARPSRVRRLLAMRACRASVMIGRALATRQMTGIVRRLGELDKPWNCPHGRPTMRHLFSLSGWRNGEGEGDGEGKSKRDGAWAKQPHWGQWIEAMEETGHNEGEDEGDGNEEGDDDGKDGDNDDMDEGE